MENQIFVPNYMIGADIEWFLRNKQTQEIVSAEGIIEGTKYDPYRFDPTNPFYATSLDNVMAEGNIPPADSPVAFYEAVERLNTYINQVVGTHNLETVALPSARLNANWLMTDNAQMFGCDPSWNCWTGDVVHPQPTGDNARCTGFHVHVGYDEPSEEVNIALAQAMDLHLGVPSVILEPKNERKTIGYGVAGNYRHQRHGMEYRSLSGFFASSRELVQWCYGAAKQAVEFVNAGRLNEILGLGDVIQKTINTEDKKTAKKLVKEFGLQLAY